MTSRLSRLAHLLPAFALFGFALAGCGGKATSPTRAGAATPLTQSQADDAAMQVGQLVMASGSASLLPAAPALASPARLLGARSSSRAGAAADTTITSGGLTWSFAIHWYGANGNEQPAYDPMLTTRLVADSRGSGAFEDSTTVISLGTAGHLDLRGLSALQDTLHTNATENDTLSFEFAGEGGSIAFLAHCSGAFTDVFELKPVESHYPMSGTAAWSMDIAKHVASQSGNSDEQFAASAVVTFNGTHLVPLVINNRYHYTLDLDTGLVTPVQV